MIMSEKYVSLSIDNFLKIIKKSLIRKWYFSIRNFVKGHLNYNIAKRQVCNAKDEKGVAFWMLSTIEKTENTLAAILNI